MTEIHTNILYITMHRDFNTDYIAIDSLKMAAISRCIVIVKT